MPRFKVSHVYEELLANFKRDRKILKEKFKYYKSSSSVFTQKYYGKEINLLNRYIKALNIAKKNQITIDNLSKNLYH